MRLRYFLSLGRDHLIFVLGGGRWAIKKNKCLKMKFSRKNYAKVSMRNKANTNAEKIKFILRRN